MTNQTIPKRSEVPEEMTWNLKDMFASDEAWMTEYEAMKAFPAKIAAFQGTLARSAGDLLAWFRLQDEIELRLSVLMGYASCKGDEDTGNSFYQDVRGKAMNVYVSIASAAAFATPEIMAIPEETLNGFYAQEPELETYRRSLYQIRPDLPGRHRQPGQRPSPDGRHLCASADQPRPGAAPPGLRDLLQAAGPVQEHHRRHPGRPVQAAVLLCQRPPL